MAIVFRVENSEGIGPYRQNDNLDIIDNMANYNQPIPYRDNGIERDPLSDELCGFISEVQAYDWFSNYQLSLLKERGYTLKKLEVKEITAIGEKQCLFIR